MILVRAWRRRLFGGIGAALIVPAALLAALALLALAGGFAGLGALGQALSGPTLPATGRGASPRPTADTTISRAVLVALAAPRTSSLRGPGGVRGAPPMTAGGPPSSRPEPSVHRGNGSSRPAGTPAMGATPPATPSPRPTLTDEVAGAGMSVTGQLPAPAGAVASAAIQAAGSTVDQVAPVPAPGPPQAP